VAGANAAAAAGTPGAPAVTTGIGAMATFWVVMLGLAAFAYPLALVPVLLTTTVRKYYSPARYD
jgi:hypothetical protein